MISLINVTEYTGNCGEKNLSSGDHTEKMWARRFLAKQKSNFQRHITL